MKKFLANFIIFFGFIPYWSGSLKAEPSLYWAITNNDAFQVWKLTQSITQLGTALENGELPVVWAVIRGSLDVLEVLLTSGADPNTKDKRGRPLAFIAAEQGRNDLVEFLMKHGAQLEKEDDLGNTFVLSAALAPHSRLLERALRGGSKNATKANHIGRTPLMAACYSGVLNSVKLLLGVGNDPYQKDYLGRNAFDYARLGNHQNILDYLNTLTKEEL